MFVELKGLARLFLYYDRKYIQPLCNRVIREYYIKDNGQFPNSPLTGVGIQRNA
jgi:hypothetical protein